MSTEDSLPNIDWKRGSVTICNGRIYVSLNCNRPHALLPEPSSSLASPFLDRGPNQLTIHDFKQPVWWNNSWGWMGFMPLSPSFLSTPFSPLAWTPKITSTDVSKVDGLYEKRYKLLYNTSHAWKQAEDCIVKACSIIRLNHTIPGELPPLPSDLGFLRHHSSQSVAKRRAEISRDWFVLWMGFLSYLTLMAQAHPHYTFPNPTDCQTVKWYSCLQERGFPHAWLEGLAKSRVCRFDADIARVGVVLRLSDTSTKHRPSIAWFMKYHIPIWFVLDAQEESWIRAQRHLSKVLPLQAMINDVLTQYFNRLSAEVKSVVMVYYLNTTFRDVAGAGQDASGCNHARQQNHFETSSTAMVDTDDFQDAKLYETWQEFFHQQEIQHAERERTKSNQDHQQRLARDKNRALKKCVIYQWKQIVSGGQIFYARIRVSRKRQEQVLISFMKKDPTTRKFNAFADPPEWDLYEHFARVGPTTTQDPESEVSDSDDVEFGSPRPKVPLDVNPSYNPTPMHAEEYYGPHNFTPLSPLPHSGVSGHQQFLSGLRSTT
ncbi:hypothetical protein BJ165DRAFT_1533500 [Panaeolus papilionaceus]|nr:hypothetical protein BJ165DRAFT_1533500 [Panaeolus papilionaceus]